LLQEFQYSGLLQKKDNHAKKVFGPVEMTLAIVIVIAAIYTIYGLIVGQITF